MNQIDLLLLHRDYGTVKTLIEQEQLKDNYHQLIYFKVNKLSGGLLTPDQFSAILNEMRENMDYGDQYQMDLETQKYQLFHFVEIEDSSTMEQLIFEFENTYDSFEQYYQIALNSMQLLRKVSYLETIFKLIQSPKQKNSYKFNFFRELMLWQNYFQKVCEQIIQNKEYYDILRKPLKELYRLSTLQLISIIEQKFSIEQYFQYLKQILKNNTAPQFLDSSTKIAIIYSIAKMILPFIDQTKSVIPDNGEILYILCNFQPKFNNYLELYEFLLFFMVQEIENKKEHQFNKSLSEKIKKKSYDLPYIDQLWYYVSVNFTQQNIKLSNSLKKLISHNIYALINIYCVKMDKYALMNKILEDLLITPFEDDTLRMKMCVILFQTEEYSKLHQLVQQLLASDSIKEHHFRPVIISMCAMFTGIYLGKAEESLCFARLNYHENLNSLLSPDTLLAQIGYCYYNLARSSKYLSEKSHFMAKSQEYLELSLKENNENYLVHFNLSKLEAQNGNIDKSLQYIDFACKINSSDLNCKIMRTLLYQAHKDNQTALKIVSSLIITYPNKPLLYLMKGAILAEIYLLNLNNDPELEISREISDDLKEFIIKKHQKSKEMQSVISNLKKALLGIAKQVYEFDQNDQFIAELAHLKTMQNFEVDPLTYINYRNCIFNAIDVLINVSLYDIAMQVLELIDDGNSTNKTEKQFYQGLLYEKQGNLLMASTIYESVLKYDFYHVRSMSRLGLIYLKQDIKIQRAGELLITASKFEKSHENSFGLAVLNQIQGNIDESNKYFIEALKIIKNSPMVSFSLVPDKLFM